MTSPLNALYYGDNLDILRQYFTAESVDLIYLDPPFNSARSYNVLFKDESGRSSDAQITAFTDTWHWGMIAEATLDDLITRHPRVSKALGTLIELIGKNQMMAYLVMMAARLVELHRVLKSTGSLYLHCDPTASHYLKIVLDTIFGAERFLAEIVWKRTSAHSAARRPGPIHDIIFLYSKSADYTWNRVYGKYSETYIRKFYRNTDEDGRKYRLSDLTGAGIRKGETGKSWKGIDVTAKGRHWMVPPSELDELEAEGRIVWPLKGKMPAYKRYLDEMEGVATQDVWDDINPLSAQSKERLGYPTQKPEALLERIIRASSNPGDIILDPFCGCGTAIAAAQKLDRRWVGIDITHLSIALQVKRLEDTFGLRRKRDYQVIGEPEDVGGARQLANDDRYQFQYWALSLVGAQPLGGEVGGRKGKKGSDRGIDGLITFREDGTGKVKSILVQVKSGQVKSGDVRDLKGTMEREQAPLGLFITLENPTKEMYVEASKAGFYKFAGGTARYPVLQILSIEDLLAGKYPDLPARGLMTTFKRAQRDKTTDGVQQLEMDMGDE